jgi:hypothetical protein
MKAFLGVIVTIFFCTPACFAELNLYLYPRVEYKAGSVSMSDIANIETDTGPAGRIEGIRIDESFFSDGYLDRKEITDILKGCFDGPFNIYGSGVRVVKAMGDAAVRDSRAVVRKGAVVRFQVVNSVIRVELTGTAMGDGAVGDEIPVKLKGSAVSRGRIINERVVRLAL